MEVFLPAFLWGFGTALGELPPYFVARAASIAGNKTEELETILNMPNSERTNLDNLKVHLTSWL